MLDGCRMIIAVSDLHLGDPVSNRLGFIEFVTEYLAPRKEDITDLVLLGDILDLWRRDNSKVLLNYMNILSKICSLGFKVTYIVGNHDIFMLDYRGQEKKKEDITRTPQLPENLLITYSHELLSGKEKFRFIHGYQSDYWYARPFYEAFCRSMCLIDEQRSDTLGVWQLMVDELTKNSPHSVSRLKQLTTEKLFQIERKLAGPLEANGSSIEESMLDNLCLLDNFVEFRSSELNEKEKNILETIRKEVTQVTTNFSFGLLNEHWIELVEISTKGNLDQIASRFLDTWRETARYIITNKENIDEMHKNQLIRSCKRIATIIVGELEHDDFLVGGHSHNPYVDRQNKIADAGCWINKKANYIVIEDGEIACNDWTQ